MRDKNFVILEGVVGEGVKKGKTVEGRKYITFVLCIDTYFKPLHDSTESEHHMTYIRLFCFDKNQVQYLERCKIRRGQRVSVFGRLQSSAHDIKGQHVIDVSVVVRDISVFKNSDDYVYTDEEVAAMDAKKKERRRKKAEGNAKQ